jgi:hypothetical protein
MVKHHPGSPDPRKNWGDFDFWEVPIEADNDVASLKLLGVEVGRHVDLSMVDQIIRGSAVPNVMFARAL